MNHSPALYELEGIGKHYNGRSVLNIERLEIREGELFTIVGPSGAGKSTLLRILHLLEPMTSGHLQYRGKAAQIPAPLEKRREIAMVFQRPELLTGSVFDNVGYPLRLRGFQDGKRVDEAIARVGLSHLSNAPAKQLSGGEMQRVALARAMASVPRVLLLDEPTANLDPYHVEVIERAVKELRESATTVILVTHNVFQAKRLADRVGLLLKGELVETSTVEAFFETPGDKRVLSFIRGEMIY
jgi:tungstate transport system ATP-binding protein